MAQRTPVGWFGLIAVPVLGVAAVISGVALRLSTTASFGWFAYAPLSDTAFAPGPPAAWALALFLILLGVTALAGWAGFLLGRRTRA